MYSMICMHASLAEHTQTDICTYTCTQVDRQITLINRLNKRLTIEWDLTLLVMYSINICFVQVWCEIWEYSLYIHEHRAWLEARISPSCISRTWVGISQSLSDTMGCFLWTQVGMHDFLAKSSSVWLTNRQYCTRLIIISQGSGQSFKIFTPLVS